MPLYPKKNLIPPLTDSRWILDGLFKVLGEYEGSLTSETPAWSTSKITIDVTVGETYYIQADIEGEFSVELWENGTINLGSFARKNLDGRSFTARYPTWEVRIVRNAQGTGYMNIKKLMVAKGSERTLFEPYVLGMKNAVTIPKKNMFTFEGSKLTSAGGSSLDIRSSNEAVVTSNQNAFTAIETAPIKVKPNTVYNINYIVERGSIDPPRVSPRKGSDRTGLTLTDGEGYKSIFFNSQSETEVFFLLYANLGTTGSIQTNRYLQVMLTESPEQPYEPYEKVIKPVTLISDGALNPPPTDDRWTLRSGTTYKRQEGKRTYWNSNQDYAGIQIMMSAAGIPESMFQGRDIVFGGEVHPMATVMFYYRRADGTPIYIGVSKATDNGARAMTIPYGSTEHRLYVQSDTGGRGELWCEDVYVKFGTEKGIKPYNPTFKPATLEAERNLIPDFNDPHWMPDTKVTGTSTMVVDPTNPHKMSMTITDSAQGRLLSIPVKSGKTYTFIFGAITGLYRLLKGKTESYNNVPIVAQDSKVAKFTVDDTWNGYVTVRLTHGAPGTYTFENLMLLEGDLSSSESFSPYVANKLKPAKLYPKKNYILPFTEWYAGSQADIKFIERTGRRVLMEVTIPSAYNGLFMPLDQSILSQLRGKSVTASVKTYNKTLSGQIQMRFVDVAGVNTEFVLSSPGQSSTRFIPIDASAVFIKIQNNVVGTSLVEVEDLQLEINSVPTDWNPYELGMKQ